MKIANQNYLITPRISILPFHRCVIDVIFNCDGGARRRREISSGVVDNVLQTAQPVDNFLLMIADVFDDDDM